MQDIDSRQNLIILYNANAKDFTIPCIGIIIIMSMCMF